jgi:hypothetical protein
MSDMPSSGWQYQESLFHSGEHAAIIDFLECFAFDEVVVDLADEQDHRRRILKGSVHADRCIGGAGAACREADARTARHFSLGIGPERGAAFLAIDNEAD